MAAARRAIPHVRETPVVKNVLLERDALGAQAALIDGVVGIALPCTTAGHTFLLLSPSVWMITPQLTEQYGQVERSRDFQLARLGVGRRQIEACPDTAAAPVPSLRKERLAGVIEHVQ